MVARHQHPLVIVASGGHNGQQNAPVTCAISPANMRQYWQLSGRFECNSRNHMPVLSVCTGVASDGDRRDRGDSSRPDSLRTSSLSLILFRSSRLSVFLRPPLGVHQMSVVRLSYRPLIDSTGSRCGQIIIRANLPPPHLSNPRSLSPTLSPLSCEMMNACKYVSTHEHTYEHVMNTRMNTRMDGCRSDPGEEGVIQEHTHTTTNRIERET